MQTNDCEGLTSDRAVWDFMTGDSRRFLDRVRLMMLAMRRFREQDITPEFVVLLHGGATKFAVRHAQFLIRTATKSGRRSGLAEACGWGLSRQDFSKGSI